MLQRMYSGNMAVIELDGGKKTTFPYDTGVKQGAKEAPALFKFLMQALVEVMAKETRSPGLIFETNMAQEGKNKGQLTGAASQEKGKSFRMACILYADDEADLCESRKTLTETLEAMDKTAERLGLQPHTGTQATATTKATTSKTLAMFIRGTGNQAKADTAPIKLSRNRQITFTQRFQYLGAIVNTSLTDQEEVETRMGKASGQFGALRAQVFAAKDISFVAKRAAYEALVLSTLLHGAETWTMTAKMWRQLHAWHQARIRQICRVNRWHTRWHHISNHELHQRTGIQPIEYYIRKRTLQWVGRVARMGPERLPRRLLTAWVRHPRPQQAPKATYGRTVLEHLEAAEIATDFQTWTKLAQEQTTWENLIRENLQTRTKQLHERKEEKKREAESLKEFIVTDDSNSE